MKYSFLVILIAACMGVSIGVVPIAGQTSSTAANTVAKAWSPPRTADGHPRRGLTSLAMRNGVCLPRVRRRTALADLLARAALTADNFHVLTCAGGSPDELEEPMTHYTEALASLGVK